MHSFKVTILLLSVLLLLLSGCERKVTEEIIKEVSPSTAAYIGSEACQSCHAATYASFRLTGHPYKLNEAEDAQQEGYYPFTTVPTPPGVNWAGIDKVIGGFWWKARYIDNDGYIITGDQVQYNFETEEFVAYHSGEVLPYNCGPCHMTNYKATGNQEDKEGLVGTWEFNGVQCEECHGPGELHADAPFDMGMVIDRTNDQCGKCHIRGDVNTIPASGGFVKHHEQWNEMFTTKHATLRCVDCHDVHYGLHPDNPEREMGIRLLCENCHFEETQTFIESDVEHYASSAGPGCIDCHMPRSAKSAVAVGPYEADVRSHLWRINTEPDAEMFNEAGDFANGYLTLEYTCLQCHASESKSWAADNADRVHRPSTFTEADDCFVCHGDDGLLLQAQGEWQASIHASGTNIDYTNRGGSDCTECHNHQGFLEFLATGSVSAPYDNVSAIHCFTCHAPHERGNLTLRTDASYTLVNGDTFDHGAGNLCANCHHSRISPDDLVDGFVITSPYWGPHHGPQGDLLTASTGYEFDGYTYSSSPHADIVDDACIGCHMGDVRIHAGYTVGGHSFNMEDEAGSNLADVCAQAGCHAEVDDDFDFIAADDPVDYDGDGAIEGYQTEFEGMVDSLRTLLMAESLLDGSDHAVPQTVADGNLAGALFNFLMVHEDRSHGVHNFQYERDLVQSSIDYINSMGGVATRPLRETPGFLSAH